MNKSRLFTAGLFSLVCIHGFADTTTIDNAAPPVQTINPNPTTPNQNKEPASSNAINNTTNSTAPSNTAAPITTPSTPTTTMPSNNAAPMTPPPSSTSTTTTTTPSSNSAPMTTPSMPGNNPAPTTKPATPATPAEPSNPPATTTPPTSNSAPSVMPLKSLSPESNTAVPTSALNCNYHIPAETSKLDTELVMQWGQQAAQQTFNFTPTTIDAELASLKACYTDQGWQSFNNALVKSGNLDAIRQQKLNVSSTLDGQSTITQIKDNQWKVVSPIQVVYQNDKEKIIQSLTINLIVSRKVSGDLGIIQIVAIPRQAVNAVPPAETKSPSSSNN